MADTDIIQRMGFDAGSAIASINSLKSALDGLNSTLNLTGKEIRSWNAGGSSASKAFDKMQKSAGGLLAQFNALAKAQATLASGAGPAAPTGGVQSQLNLIQQLTGAWGALPASVNSATRQAFGGGIAAAAQFAAANKMTAQQVVQAYATMGAGASGSVAQLGAMLKGLSATHAAAAGQIQQHNGHMTMSFKTLLQILQFRVVISALTSLTQKFQEGVKAGADFSRQLGMIQTVAEAGANIGKIEQQLVDLSREFAKPLPDVAAAYYLTLQNQVGDAAQSMEVLNQAAKLSVSTGSSMTDAVDTLTVALNGFKVGADQAGNVSGKLFKAMEIGRFQFSQMKDTMGRIAPIAHELGISLEEVLGPVSTMTRQGVRFDTAITQMRAVVSQLIKPTKALKAIYQEKWGVENVEQALAKFGGLLPMLKALETELGGNSAAFGKAFTNLRAFTGLMSILGSNYKEAVADTQKIKEANEALSDSMYQMVAKTPGQKFAQVINQINTDFAQLGQSLLPLLNPVLTVIQAITNAISNWGIPIAIGAVGALGAAVWPAVTACWAWVAAINGVKASLVNMYTVALPILVGLGAGVLLGEFLNPYILQMRGFPVEAQKMHQELLVQEKKYADSVRKAASEEAATRIAYNKQIISETVAGLTTMQVAHAKTTDAVAARNKNMLSTVKDTFATILSTQEKIVNKLLTTAEDGGKSMEDATKRYADASKNAAQKAFDIQLVGLNEVDKASSQMARADMLRREALNRLSTATRPEDFTTVEDLLSRSAQNADAAASSLGSGADNADMLQEAMGKGLAVSRAMMEVENRRRSVLAEEASLAVAETAKEKLRLEYMKEAVATILKGYEVPTTAKPKTESQIIADAAAAQDAWDGLYTIITTDNQKLTQGDLLGLVSLRQNLNAAANKLPALKTQVDFEYEAGLDELMSAFNLIPKEIRIAFPGLDKFSPYIDLMNRLIEKQKSLVEMAPKIAAYNAEVKLLSNIAQNQIAKPFGDMIPSADLLNKTTTPLNIVTKSYHQLIIEMQRLGAIDPAKDMAGFQTALSSAGVAMKNFEESKAFSSLSGGILEDLIDPNTIEAMKNGLQELNQQMYGKVLPAPGAELVPAAAKLSQDIETARSLFGGLNVTIPPELTATMTGINTQAQNIQTNTSGTNTAMQMLSISASAAASAYERIAFASQNIAPMPVTGMARGGAMRFASGGNTFQPRGTDNIPAMLSKGEFVVNAKSTRRFFSQLVAMNAGAQPLYRQDGGSVTNVGDINVSVNGSASTRQTAREIATALRREVRRGTSKL